MQTNEIMTPFAANDRRNLLVQQAKAVTTLLLNATNGSPNQFDVDHLTVCDSLALIHELLEEASE